MATSSKTKKTTKKATSKTKKTTFKVKERQEMLMVLEGHDYAALVDTAIERLKLGVHLRRYESRAAFVGVICDEPVRPTLIQCVMEMIAGYLEMYRSCMKGKKYLKFEQRQFESISDFIDGPLETSSQAQSWHHVTKRAEQNGSILTISEQRIVLSTLAFTVHDLMAKKVVEFKKEKLTEDSDSMEVGAMLIESNVALYRYGGFAIHSMVQKRQPYAAQANVKCELELISCMKIKVEEWDQLPPAIQQLSKGGLQIPSPTLLPLLRKIVEMTSSLVNDQKCKENGRHMIRIAKQELESCTRIREIFDDMIPQRFSTESKAIVYTELLHKIFHARVNEYMNAADEIELERSDKAVRADQSLRDTLKTFSGMTSASTASKVSMRSPHPKLSTGTNNTIFNFCAIFRVFQNRVTIFSSQPQSTNIEQN